MALGYFDDLADAELYFTNERLETAAWDTLDEAGLSQKTKVITNAYNRIYYDPRWMLPTYSEATAAQLVILKKANAEMAYYLAVHLADEDERKGIQAQAVIKAGIVKEDYLETALENLPVPPFVIAILIQFAIDNRFAVVSVGRDEEEEDEYLK